jgi:hypothetical protein
MGLGEACTIVLLNQVPCSPIDAISLSFPIIPYQQITAPQTANLDIHRDHHLSEQTETSLFSSGNQQTPSYTSDVSAISRLSQKNPNEPRKGTKA